MSNESPRVPRECDDTNLQKLISAWCDGEVAEADFRRLEATLAASKTGRRTFVELMHIHARMQDQSTDQESAPKIVPFPQSIAESPESPILSPPPLGFLRMVLVRTGNAFRGGWTWAAVLLIGIMAWGAVHLIRGPTTPIGEGSLSINQVRSPERVSDSNQSRAVVAWVTEQSADCEWLFDPGSQAHREPPEGVCSGDTIRATKGIMKLTFDNGTIVTLHGPALFQVMSNMRVRVFLGTLTAHVAAGAEGFSILTPRATVIDLGTEFGVQVNEVGATDVVVFHGEVDLDYMNHAKEFARQRLRIGEGMRLDARGTASRIVSITDDVYSVSPANESLRPPVITAVRDNIPRGALNYYEVVTSGMREDAKAFADREGHEWNGVTTTGMPSYLLGGDYVKTFNNDKCSHDIEITVTLNRAAKLYILFDKRIPPPEWLKKGFRNTGDEIGVDEGPFYCLDQSQLITSHKPGVGPGVSIDNVSSIWVCDVAGPGCVKLGPTESISRDINMYGIVAVPVVHATAAGENK